MEFASRWEIFQVRVGPPACWAAAVAVHNDTLYAFGGQTYEVRAHVLVLLLFSRRATRRLLIRSAPGCTQLHCSHGRWRYRTPKRE